MRTAEKYRSSLFVSDEFGLAGSWKSSQTGIRAVVAEYLGAYQRYTPTKFIGECCSSATRDVKPVNAKSEDKAVIVEGVDGVFTLEVKSKTTVKDEEFKKLVNSVLKK
ncbi:MAG: hypothetical protein CR988_02915 [Treponema sp.]|nr:MAG: hypothetical protein CR988_02915 [Treponema sp.]